MSIAVNVASIASIAVNVASIAVNAGRVGGRRSLGLILLGALLVSCASPGRADSFFGDITGSGLGHPDGVADIKDVVQVLKYAVHLSDPTPDQAFRANVAPVKADGSFGDCLEDAPGHCRTDAQGQPIPKVDVSDVVRLLRRAVAIEADPWPHRRVVITLTKGGGAQDIGLLAEALKNSSNGLLSAVTPDPRDPNSFVGVIDPAKVRVDNQEVKKVLTANAASAGSDLIESIESDHLNFAARAPNDPDFAPKQWNLDKIGAQAGWDITTGTSNVVIAVLDSGVDLHHPELAGKLLAHKNFAADNEEDDVTGHGTHIAGIATALSNNGVGIAGLCWDCGLISARVLNSLGRGWASVSAAGIRWVADWAADHPDKRVIINMSYRDYDPSQVEQEAIQYAASKGVVLVASAGNDDTDKRTYPAGYPEVIAVGATDENDKPASFTNYGDWVDLAAPGTNIYSTVPTHEIVDKRLGQNYGVLSGTSQSAPQVTGLAGLILSRNATLTRDQVKDLIVKNADTVPGDVRWQSLKRINVAKTLQATVSPNGLPNVRPNAPNPVDPPNQAQIQPAAPITFQWQDTGDPDSGPSKTRTFEVSVKGPLPTLPKSDQADPSQPWPELANSGRLTATNWAWTVPAGQSGAFAWSVRSFDGADNSEWSSTQLFRVQAPLAVLSVASEPPGVSIAATPGDKDLKQGGITPFSLTYASGARVTLTAPAQADLNGKTYTFVKWSGGAAGVPTLAVSLNGSQAATAVYATANRQPPTAAAQQVSVTEDTPTTITLTGAGDGIQFQLLTPPSRGVLTGTAPTYTYTPDKDYDGPDSLTFKVTDSTGQSSDPALVSITVTPVNDPPEVFGPGDQTVTAGSPFLFVLETYDPDSPNVTLQGQNLPAGTNVQQAPGTTQYLVGYIPSAAQIGQTIALTFVASDGIVSVPYTVHVTVIKGLGQYSNINEVRGKIFTVAGGFTAADPQSGVSYPAYLGDNTTTGSLLAAFAFPNGIAFDGAGALYIADYANNRIRRVDPNTFAITTVAGEGTPGFSGDGGPAPFAQLNHPAGIWVDGGNNLIIADSWNHRVRVVYNNSGVITTYAGASSQVGESGALLGGFSGDEGPAGQALMNFPIGIWIDRANILYIADYGNNCVRAVEADPNSGIPMIYTFAGTGGAAGNGFGGDGGPAGKALLSSPTDVMANESVPSAVWIADSGNNRIRLVNNADIISTLAGTGVAGFSGDGGPAAAAQLNRPYEIIANRLGDLFFTDPGNQRVRMVDRNGVIKTIAGNGEAGFSGDGDDALQARLNTPVGIYLDANGNVYFADTFNQRIRVVFPRNDPSTGAIPFATGRRGFDTGLGGDGPLSSLMPIPPGADRGAEESGRGVIGQPSLSRRGTLPTLGFGAVMK